MQRQMLDDTIARARQLILDLEGDLANLEQVSSDDRRLPEVRGRVEVALVSARQLLAQTLAARQASDSEAKGL